MHAVAIPGTFSKGRKARARYTNAPNVHGIIHAKYIAGEKTLLLNIS